MINKILVGLFLLGIIFAVIILSAKFPLVFIIPAVTIAAYFIGDLAIAIFKCIK